MKILAFNPYYPPHVGGLESHAAEFDREMIALGHRVTVFTPRLPQSAPKTEENGNLLIVRFPAVEIVSNFPIPAFWRRAFWRQFAKIRRRNYDLVISRTRFFLTSFLALVYAKLNGTKLVHIEHGSDFVQLSSKFKNLVAWLYDMTLGRAVLRFSDLNVSISEAVRKFVARFDSRPSPVIYRGVCSDLVKKVSTPEQKIPTEKTETLIGYAGRLVANKGLDILIAAAEKLSTENFALVIVGDGPEKDKLEKFSIEKGLGRKIKFLGEKSRVETVKIIQDFDIFVNPSYTEGLPTGVLEAAAVGCAVVATDVGGTNEIISNGENGFLIPPGDAEILAEKLKFLLENPACGKNLGQQASSSVLDRFNWKNSAIRYEKIFNRLLGRK